jgi:hypothetical protein
LSIEQFVEKTVGRKISLEERHLLIKTTIAMDALGLASLGSASYGNEGGDAQEGVPEDPPLEEALRT